MSSPELLEVNFEADSAFWHLNHRRKQGFNGQEFIEFGEIESYCLIYGIDNTRELTDKILAADDFYMNWQRERKGN